MSAATTAQLVVAGVAGAVAAGAYFGGLWLTVRRLPHAAHPTRWLLASMAVRLVLLLGAFYLIVRVWGGAALLACAGGFVVVRTILAWTVHRPPLARPENS